MYIINNYLLLDQNYQVDTGTNKYSFWNTFLPVAENML